MKLSRSLNRRAVRRLQPWKESNGATVRNVPRTNMGVDGGAGLGVRTASPHMVDTWPLDDAAAARTLGQKQLLAVTSLGRVVQPARMGRRGGRGRPSLPTMLGGPYTRRTISRESDRRSLVK